MAVDPSVPSCIFGPPTPESQSRKNHVNSDLSDLLFGPLKMSLVPYHESLPFSLQVFFKVIVAVNQIVKDDANSDLF